MNKHTLKDIQSWYTKPVGEWVLDQEQHLLDQIWPECFGYYLLELGLSPAVTQLSCASRLRNHVYLSPASAPEVNIVSEFTDLPLASDSVDVVLVHHWLGMLDNPVEALEEIYRVLVPEGRVIICGLRPAWWCGWYDKVAQEQRFPWSFHSARVGELKRWLGNVGFTMVKRVRHSYGLSLQVNNLHLPNLFYTFKGLAQVGLPYGSGYIIVAQKKISTLMPIKPKWSVYSLPVKDVKPTIAMR